MSYCHIKIERGFQLLETMNKKDKIQQDRFYRIRHVTKIYVNSWFCATATGNDGKIIEKRLFYYIPLVTVIPQISAMHWKT